MEMTGGIGNIPEGGSGKSRPYGSGEQRDISQPFQRPDTGFGQRRGSLPSGIYQGSYPRMQQSMPGDEKAGEGKSVPQEPLQSQETSSTRRDQLGQEQFNLGIYAREVFSKPRGFATRGILQKELKDLGQDPKEATKITAAVTPRIGDFVSPIPEVSELRIEKTTVVRGVNMVTIYFNSALMSRSEAENRYLRYEEEMQAVRETEQTLAPQQTKHVIKEKKKDKAMVKEEEPVRVRTVIGLAGYDLNPDEIIGNAFIDRLGENIPPKPIRVPTEDYSQAHIIGLTELSQFPEYGNLIRNILDRGVTEAVLEKQLPFLRAIYQELANTRQGIYVAAAQDIANRYTTEADQHKKRSIAIAAPVTRRFLVGVASEVRAALGNDPTVSVLQTGEFLYLPYAEEAIDNWRTRYSLQTLTAHQTRIQNLASAGNASADFIVKLLQRDDREKILQALRTTPEAIGIEDTGETTKREDLDTFLSPILISDELLTRSIFGDTIREAYPISKIDLQKEYKELDSLVESGLRELTEQFSLNEIRSILLVQPADLDQLKKDFTATEARWRRTLNEESRIRGKQKGKGEKQSTLLKRQLDELQAMIIRKTTVKPGEIQNKIKKEVERKVPTMVLSAQVYDYGENSPAYKIALEIYQKNIAAGFESIPPDPEDYYGGSDSQAYIKTDNFRETLKLLKLQL